MLKNKSVRVLTHCSSVFLMVAFWRGQSTCCKLNLSFRRRPEILPDNKGLSWFPVFLNGSQLCFSFFSLSECCPITKQSSENNTTERSKQGWKNRSRRTAKEEIMARRVQQKHSGLMKNWKG